MQAFSALRVIDLTHVIAGPFCTYQLAVMGADVIKIESPQAPDMVREDGPLAEEVARGMGSVFTAQNANKRSIALDLKSPEGRDIAITLIRDADVLVENYRSGALAELGLGYQGIRKINPDIIYCSLTGFGQTGPKAQHTAYDNVIQAFSGLMASTGDEHTAPMKVGPPVLDYGTGAQAAFAIAAALFQRSQTGEGQYIDIAMLDSALMLMSANITHYHAAGKPAALTGNNSASKPGYACYSTAKGLLMIGAYTSKQHAAMWRVLGSERRAQAAESASLAEIGAQMDEDIQAISAVLETKSADEWEALMNQAKVPAARVRTVDETLAHEQVLSRSVIQAQADAGASGPLPVASFRYNHHGPQVNTPPPLHGQHTREILSSLGFSAEKIAALQRSGVVKLG